MSLAEQISRLTNPAPAFDDPEDIIDETGAKLLDVDEDDADYSAVPSKLRSRVAATLEQTDARYKGRRVSRRSLDSDSDVDSEITDDDDNDEDKSSGRDNIARSGEDVIQSESEEEELEGFREKMKFQEPSKQKFSIEDDGDYGKFGDDQSGDDEDESGSDDDEPDDESGDEESDGDEESPMDDDDEGNLQQFTKVNVEEEIQKGRAVKAQLGIWDSLLECRIKLQKALILINQLPQPDTGAQFSLNKGLNDNGDLLQSLLEQLVALQTDLFSQNSDTKHLVSESPSETKSVPAPDDDEEITSESDTETVEKPTSTPPAAKPLKRKLKSSQYPEFIAKRHSDFTHLRNATIQRWYDKTRIASGKSSKGFAGFEQSAVKQIEQILTDRERLIRRTQLRRSAYRVLGKPDPDEIEPEQTDQETPETSTQKDYDAEIFDDDDFYHQQLRELIERKTADINDPVALSRQWLEIQKLRRKTRKNVDTKASKGRKIRYDVHKKMVNFMAPYDPHRWTEEAKDELFKSLFGKTSDDMEMNR